MKNLLSLSTILFVACILVASPPERLAHAADAGGAPAPAPPPPPPPGPAPAPSPAPGGDCSACFQCFASCTTTYGDCQRKCFAQPDIKSQQACAQACQGPIECAKNCPCSGCTVPGLPH